ncbi:MAG: LysE family translocator [Haloarculaceae archaeon]
MAPLPDATALVAFAAAATALVVTPGPDTAFVLAQSVGGGRAAGVRAAAGVNAGILVHTLAAALGLSALFRVAPAAYAAVRLAGGCYLLWLGARTLRGDGALALDSDSDAVGAATADGSFRQGLLTNLLNPKVALFFLAFLPGFGRGLELLPLGGLYAVVGFAYLGGLALASGRARDALLARTDARDRLRRVSGGAMVALGGLVLAGDRLP